MLEYIETQAAWKGEPINDVRHPRDIETKWTANELAAVGLRVKPAPPPPTPEPPPVETLDEVKARLRAMVDVEAEVYRLKFITPGVGQAMTYQEKRDQAEQVIADGQAAADALNEQQRTLAYPTLAASVGIEAQSLWDCANLVRVQYEAWATLSNFIEKKRLAGKAAISTAADEASAQAAYDAIVWS